MDGLPGLEIGVKTAKEEHIAPMEKMVGPQAPKHYRNKNRFGVGHLVLVAVISALFAFWSFAFVTSRGIDLPAGIKKFLNEGRLA